MSTAAHTRAAEGTLYDDPLKKKYPELFRDALSLWISMKALKAMDLVGRIGELVLHDESQPWLYNLFEEHIMKNAGDKKRNTVILDGYCKFLTTCSKPRTTDVNLDSEGVSIDANAGASGRVGRPPKPKVPLGDIRNGFQGKKSDAMLKKWFYQVSKPMKKMSTMKKMGMKKMVMKKMGMKKMGAMKMAMKKTPPMKKNTAAVSTKTNKEHGWFMGVDSNGTILGCKPMVTAENNAIVTETLGAIKQYNPKIQTVIYDRACKMVNSPLGPPEEYCWVVDKFHGRKHTIGCACNPWTSNALWGAISNTNSSIAEQVFSLFRNYNRIINSMSRNRSRMYVLWLAHAHNKKLRMGDKSHLPYVKYSYKKSSNPYDC